MYEEMLRSRNLPTLKTKKEMLDVLLEEEYGFLPAKPMRVTWEIEEDIVKRFCANKASYSKVKLHCELQNGTFSFPFSCVVPKKDEPVPFFIHINFRPDVPDRYMPTEELVDHGFAVLSFCYEDVTKDNSDFTDGLAGLLFANGERQPSDCGKIAMWAWAAQRVMDYAQSDSRLEKEGAVVCGHSRLGKTALLAAATDERFKFAHSNNSGCSGAAISRGKTGERIEDICNRFPYWFCENYKKYSCNEEKTSFDQHYLIASIAPRFVSVGSAIEDTWADPLSEMLSCVAASESFEQNGIQGFVYCNKNLEAGDVYNEGHICYSLRSGSHYFSREDWLNLIRFIKKHFI
jgi:hypothetical protein